jgi:hypothetical protein
MKILDASLALWRGLIAAPRVILDIAIIAAVGVLAFAILYRPAPKPIITQGPEHTQIVQIPVDHLTERTIVSYAIDKAGTAALMREMAALKVQVAQLTETLGEHQSSGSGPVIVTPTPALPSTLHFEDWRLTFDSDGKLARYLLRQKFEVLTASGRREDGSPLSLVKLYEIGPGEARALIEAKTTVVVADSTRVHWYAHLNIQGGLTWTGAVGGVAGLQWMKRGRTHAPGDTAIAILTPVIRLSQLNPEFGILPVSWNLGTLPHQPFTNVWISPYVGISAASQSVSRIGVALTATF